MIDFLAEYARAIVFFVGGMTAAGYAWHHKRIGGGELHREIYALLLVWLAGTSLPVSALLVWLMFQPYLMPQMVGALQDFSMHLGAYGGVAFFVVFRSLWIRWPRAAKNDG